MENMKDFISYNEALELKELGFDKPCFNRFYTKPQSKMFGVDEKGRNYPIKNTSKKLYIMGEDFVLNDSNVILAPTYSQAFRWFREKYNLYAAIYPIKQHWECDVRHTNKDVNSSMFTWNNNFTHEEAELACLQKLIQIVKNEKLTCITN